MTLKNTISFFENLIAGSTKRSEIKVFNEFIDVLKKLEQRAFTTKEMQSIEVALDRLDLKSHPENRKKFFQSALNQFRAFLKDEFSLTPNGYYMNLSVSSGMLLGVIAGVLIGQRFERSLGISLGVCLGLFLGAFIGRRLDAQVKAAGNML